MHVQLDLNALTLSKKTGVAVYATEITKALHSLSCQDKNFTVSGLVKWSRYKRLSHVKTQVPIPVFLWPKWQNLFVTDSNTVYHGLDFKVTSMRSLCKVVTIHDLVEYADGDFVPNHFRQQGQKAITKTLKNDKPDAIITVSDFSKQHILQYFPEYKDRIYTVYHGADHRPDILHLSLPNEKISALKLENYLFFIGTIEKRKNVQGLLKAFDVLKSKPQTPKNLKLFIAGGHGYGAQEILDLVPHLKYKNDITFLPYLTTDEIPYYFKFAKACVFPTFYEGFGLPALEALRLKCPLITSNLGAVAEITINCAYHCNPYDIEDIAQKTLDCLLETHRTTKHQDYGFIHSQKFAWSESAIKTKKVYDECLKNRS